MRRPLSLIALAVLLTCCAQPSSYEQFVRSDKSGEYSFTLDMSDTLAAYDLAFYTLIDRPLFQRDTLVSFPLNVVWRSPSGRYFFRDGLLSGRFAARKVPQRSRPLGRRGVGPSGKRNPRTCGVQGSWRNLQQIGPG